MYFISGVLPVLRAPSARCHPSVGAGTGPSTSGDKRSSISLPSLAGLDARAATEDQPTALTLHGRNGPGHAPHRVELRPGRSAPTTSPTADVPRTPAPPTACDPTRCRGVRPAVQRH